MSNYNNRKDILQRTPKSVINAVSESFKKFSPFTSTKKRSKSSRKIQLTAMNIPPLAAKRDIAYQLAIEIFNDKADSTSSGELLIAYSEALKLLNTADQAHSAITNTQLKMGIKQIPDILGSYLRILSDLVSSALFTLNSSANICSDEQTFKYLLDDHNREKTAALIKSFGVCESSIRNAITELYTKSEKSIAEEKNKMINSFSEDELDRYTKSVKEFANKLTEAI